MDDVEISVWVVYDSYHSPRPGRKPSPIGRSPGKVEIR
jgi:hypothetical protein